MFTEKITSKKACIGIIGMGYVGLPLGLAFVNKGFSVLGFDIDPAKVEKLNCGKSYIKHILENDIHKAVQTGLFQATDNFAKIHDVDAIIICVPTPLTENREPDLSFIENTVKSIAPFLKRGQLISLESTTFPGTTEEVVIPIIKKMTDLDPHKDLYMVYSPEREDPGNKHFNTSTINKVVGGSNETALHAGIALYSQIVPKVIPVSSTQAAELTKLFENIFRSVNIALANEMKVLCQRMNIDFWEVIDAAATKPFGFMPFYPGPGLGGHCIPIDPFYLTWKAREFEYTTRFIELAGEINTSMPYYVVERLQAELNKKKKCINGAKILVLGLAYKKDVDDDRESPSFKVMELLTERGAIISYNDPYCPATRKTRKYDLQLKSMDLSKENIQSHDCTLILTDHTCYDWNFIVEHSHLIVDTRNATKNVKNRSNIAKA